MEELNNQVPENVPVEPQAPQVVNVGPKAYTGYPHHKPGGRGFAKGHKKLGGIKKGTKRFKTLFIEELEATGIDEQGRTVRNSIAITKKAIEMARAGNLQAIEFIVERVDGKVPNIIAGDDENPLTIVIESDIASKYIEHKGI